MDELGHILREARETKGLTLAEVQEKTRISVKYLEALETGNYHQLPSSVHAKGFLRNYARFLGLDPQPLVDRYELSLNHGGYRTPHVNGDSSTPIPAPLRPDQPFFNPVNVEIGEKQRRDPESSVRLIIIVALIVTLFLVGNRFLPVLTGNGDGTAVQTEGLIEAVRQFVNQGETATPEPDSALAVTITPGAVITPTNRNTFETTPAPLPTRPNLPATMEEVQLRIEITERTWMEVTIDGDIVFSGWATQDDPAYEWVAQEEAKVKTGNANGIVVTINGVLLGRMGAYQEVKEEVWRTTN